MRTLRFASTVGVVSLLFFAINLLAQTDCSTYNVTSGPFDHVLFDTQQHTSGEHFWDNQTGSQCSYSGTASQNGPVGCSVVAKADDVPSGGEDGNLSVPLHTHYLNVGESSGTANANNGGSAAADAEGAFAVQSCVLSCSTTISITGSGQGTGFTVGFTPLPLWSDKDYIKQNCAGVTLPKLSSCPSPTSPYPGQSTQNGYYTWDPNSCTWVWVPCQPGINCNVSPVIIDTTNTGFVFTDPRQGQYVSFDMAGNGKLIKVSWPKVGSGNAWLVYDRDGDGIIKDGTELFGNFTPHSDGDVPNRNPHDLNGFLAMQWYDHLPQGGNGDLVLDKKDAIWKHLRLWIDEHCYLTPDDPCQSHPSELYTLESKGIQSLSLIYDYDPQKKDWIGNKYTFYAVVNPEISDAPTDANGVHRNAKGESCCDLHKKSKDGRLMYDVFLVAVP